MRVIQAASDNTAVYEVEDFFYEGLNRDVDDSVYRIQLGIRYEF